MTLLYICAQEIYRNSCVFRKFFLSLPTKLKTFNLMRILLLLIAVLIPFQLSAQPAAVKKVINKYDAKYLKRAEGFHYPKSFWDAIKENDPRLKKLDAAYKKEEKDLFETFAAMAYYIENHPEYDFVVNDYDLTVLRIVHDLGIEDIVKKTPVKVIRDHSINASMDAMEQFRINCGCFEKLTYEEILAVCAHEMAHCVCEHVVMSLWKETKKRKVNKMWADIGTGLFIGTVAATSGYAGANGQDVSHFNDIIAHSDILFNGAYNYAEDATIKYRYRYSRDEESEADILAYRFMEALGYGGEHLLSMLKKIKELYGDTPAGKYDDHPSTTFRIQVISALMSGYNSK